MKKTILFFFSLLIYFSSNLSFSQAFSQEDTDPTPFEGITDNLPEDTIGFTPIASIPEYKNKEPLSDFTNKKPKKKSPYRAGFQFGGQYGQYDKLPYTDIIFSPYIELGPFFFLYEIPLRFDWFNSFITKTWTSTAANISKIEMSLYYSKTNSLFKFIQSDITPQNNLFLGHGRFFYDYDADQYGPYETVKSFTMSLDASYIGMKYILANIASPDLMGAELFIKPLCWIKDTKYEFYKNFKIYASYGLDMSPFHDYSTELYNFGNNPNSPMLSMIDIGVDIPLFDIKNKFNMFLYTDFSYIFENVRNDLVVNSGSGISYGMIMTIMQTIPIQFEISHASGFWQPRWVNKFYNLDRIYIADPEFPKDNKVLNTIPNLTYYSVSIGYQWIERSTFFNAEIYGDTDMNDLWVSVGLKLGKELLKLFTIDFSVTMRGLVNGQAIVINQNNFILELETKYHMLPNMYWGLQWKYSPEIGDITVNEFAEIGSKAFHFLGLNFSFRY